MDERINSIIEKTKGIKNNSKLLFEGRFVKVYEEEYTLPSGRVIKKERVTKNNGKEAAVVITRTIDDKYIMVFQNRVDNIVSCEFPSGYIEEGESPEEAAIRELEEETGYSGADAKEIDSFISSIGTESSVIHLIYVSNAKKIKEQELDTDEFINIELFTFDELTYLFNKNIIRSGGNRLAYYHLKEILNK